MDSNIPLDEIFDTNSFETIAESPVSRITAARYRTPHAHAGLVAIKSASTLQEFSMQPHDIRKELRILASLAHPNIIAVLGSIHEAHTASLHFWMPLVPYTLAHLLASPRFSPHAHAHALFPAALAPPAYTRPQHFAALARAITHQLLAALAYLHAPARRIAHRDIKPANVLLTPAGCAKLVDFGIAWAPSSDADDLWPEPDGAMCAHVCSGPYRAPETIFSPHTYDAPAVDLWSAGATLAEFFTRLRFRASSLDDEDDEDDFRGDQGLDADAPQDPYYIPPGVDPRRQQGEWVRDPLFDARRGPIGLAWSIFTTRGTPTRKNWPSFHTLPDASKLSFAIVPPTDLCVRLPNLPPQAGTAVPSPPDHNQPHNPIHSASDSDYGHGALDLLLRLLVYEPARRLSAAEALQHPWLSVPPPLLLPPELGGRNEGGGDGLALGEILNAYMH